MGVKTGAGTFKNPLIKDNFKTISRDSVLYVLENSLIYLHLKEMAYKDVGDKISKEIQTYSSIKIMTELDKLYWEKILTLNGQLETPLFCGEIVYEAIREKLSTINYGD